MKRLSVAAFGLTALFFSAVSFFPTFRDLTFHKLSDFGLPQASQPKSGDIWTDPVSGIDFVWVPGGDFIMGCSYAWIEGCIGDEKPTEPVTIQGFTFGGGTPRWISGFWLGKTEVTQAQWERVMENNPSEFKGADRPVESVSWDDVQAFTKKLNDLGDDTFRLPSPSEWEYACRSGGNNERYCGGGDADALGWHAQNRNGKFGTLPVAGKQANGLGIYDMSGNVWEWAAYCINSSCDEPHLRGGSALQNKSRMVSTYKIDYIAKDFKNVDIGFRIVRIKN